VRSVAIHNVVIHNVAGHLVATVMQQFLLRPDKQR